MIDGIKKKKKEIKPQASTYRGGEASDPLARTMKLGMACATRHAVTFLRKIFSFSAVKVLSVLFVVLGFGAIVLLSGVLGDTTIGLTLTSNKNLDKGLMAHWTLDGKDFDVSSTTAEVVNKGGSKHGNAVGYQANAVNFDNANDFLNRGADLTGNADGTQWTGSVWFRRLSSNSVDMFFSNTGRGAEFSIAIADDIDIKAENSSGTSILNASTATTFTDTNWHHLLFSIDLSDTGKRHVYIDGVAESMTWHTYNTAETIDFTKAEHIVGAEVGGNNKFHGDVVDFWLDFNRYIDLSVESNRRKFRDRGGNTVDLGSNCERPTGTPPLMCFSGGTSNWQNNLGSGGGFAENGAITDGTDPTAGDIPPTSPGRLGQAITFDGKDDYIDIGNLGSGVQTIAFWMRVATTTSNMKIIDIDGTDQIELNGSSAVTATSFPAATVYVDGSSASATISDKEWHHVVIVDTTGVNASDFDIGRVDPNYFGGILDDVRVYNRVLTQNEIDRLYELGK